MIDSYILTKKTQEPGRPAQDEQSVSATFSASTSAMLEYRTQGFQGYAVKYSPFFDNRIAVATAANYGLVGNGRLYALELTPHGIVPLKMYSPTCD